MSIFPVGGPLPLPNPDKQEVELVPRFRTVEGQVHNVPLFAYDSFVRPNSAQLGGLESGQLWREEVGDLEINGNALKALTLTGAEAIAAFEFGDQADFLWARAIFTWNTAVTTIGTAGLLFRFASQRDHLIVQIESDGVNAFLRLYDKTANLYTQRASTQLNTNPVAGNQIVVMLWVGGPIIQASCHASNNPNLLNAALVADDPAITWTALFKSATGMGVRFSSVIDHDCHAFIARGL